MKHADEVLSDETLVATVYEALVKRRPKSRNRGRLATPAEVVVRLLVLKHVRNWSYGVLEREVRANLVYRNFTREGAAKMPDAKTMGRWGRALGPRAIKQIHERIVQIALSLLKTSSDPECWRITPAGRRFCPMVSFYRNAIETARANRRARRALVWECVALQHQLAVLVEGRCARGFALPIGCSGCLCRDGGRPGATH
jgi:hypothetical protein